MSNKKNKKGTEHKSVAGKPMGSERKRKGVEGRTLGPLHGRLVIDTTRMLPGAIVVRNLVDLGARVIKVESPEQGEILRHLPPKQGGLGAGFETFFRGVESICLDLREKEDAVLLKEMTESADVLMESFRPGRMERWGVGLAKLRKANARLVTCSLSGYGRNQKWMQAAGHDLNFASISGLLSMFPPGGIPRIQPVDVCAALLALSSILAALLERQKTGRGRHVEQPLASGSLPLMTWAWADEAAGGNGVSETLLGGACPCYKLYECGDGGQVALGAIEDKFWNNFVRLIGLSHLQGKGKDVGERGAEVMQEIAKRMKTRSRDEWVAMAQERGLPLTPVNNVEEAIAHPYLKESLLVEERPAAGAKRLKGAAPHMISIGQTPASRAPRLGEHTDKVLEELTRGRRSLKTPRTE